MISWSLLLVPFVALLRSLFGWAENSFRDGKIDLFEWKKLGETVVRMVLPIFALIFAFKIDPGVASGIGLIVDWIVVKIYSALV